MKNKTRTGHETTWTDLRAEIRHICASSKLNIKPLNIHEWQAVECCILSHFTGEKGRGITWMWENQIRKEIEHYERKITKWSTLSDILKASIPIGESLWLFLEDSLRFKTKFWGYCGDIGSIIALLAELPLCDFYLVSQKRKWIVGQNHDDVLFAYGEMARLLENRIKESSN